MLDATKSSTRLCTKTRAAFVVATERSAAITPASLSKGLRSDPTVSTEACTLNVLYAFDLVP